VVAGSDSESRIKLIVVGRYCRLDGLETFGSLIRDLLRQQFMKLLLKMFRFRSV
jgi:hypothetical protein